MSRGGRGGRSTPKSNYRHFMTVVKSFDPSAAVDEKEGIGSIKGPIIVIIRHGRTEHNKLGLFTGWQDCHLAAEGVL